MEARTGVKDITALLRQWRAGDASALGRLMPLAYPQLRAIAAGYLRHEQNARTLQPTALVNELYLRLFSQRKVALTDRAHFYAFAAKLMRLLLTDHARAALAGKRGGGARHVPLSDAMPWVNADSGDVLELNRALEELEAMDARKVRVVELRHFLGCTATETAEMLSVSKVTVDRDLRLAQSWLFHRLRRARPAVSEA